MRRSRGLLVCLVGVHCGLLLFGCRSRPTVPDLGEIYNRAAQYHGEGRNPVIVIPGILGSRLVKGDDGSAVWGLFGGDYADPSTADGAGLIAVPMREGAALHELTDDVVPDGVLDSLEVNVFGLPIEFQAYMQILGTLGVGGYRDEQFGLAGAIDYGDDHFTCFQFGYDWRRDNAENAKRLHEFILEKRAYIAAELRKRGLPPREIKFDLIAHSMGGLISRYYLRYGAADLPTDGSTPEVTWAGAENVERAILVGTPNAGSIYAFDQLVHGISFSRLFPKYSAALLGTMPSIYQLMPRPRHGAFVQRETGQAIEDIFDASTWQQMKWGLASFRQDETLELLLPDVPDAAARRRIALDHQRKCLDRARRFAAALDLPAAPPDGLRLYLIAGDSMMTGAVAAISRHGAVEIVETAPGDGTVLRSSALMDERVGSEWSPHVRSPVDWRQATFLFTDHLGLTSDPAFTDNVLYILLEDPR